MSKDMRAGGGEKAPPENKARSSVRAPARVDYAALISGGVKRASLDASPQAVVVPEENVRSDQLQEGGGGEASALVPTIEGDKAGQVGTAGVHPASDVAAEEQVKTVSRPEGGAAEPQGMMLEIAPGVVVRFADKKSAEAWTSAQALKTAVAEQTELKLKRQKELEERQRAAVQEQALLQAQDALNKAEQDAAAFRAEAEAELKRIHQAKVQVDFERDEAKRALALLEARAEQIENENVEVRQVLAVAEAQALETAMIIVGKEDANELLAKALMEKDDAISALALKEVLAREQAAADSERDESRRVEFRQELQKEREEDERRRERFIAESQRNRESYEGLRDGMERQEVGRAEQEAALKQLGWAGLTSKQEAVLAAAKAMFELAQKDQKELQEQAARQVDGGAQRRSDVPRAVEGSKRIQEDLRRLETDNPLRLESNRQRIQAAALQSSKTKEQEEASVPDSARDAQRNASGASSAGSRKESEKSWLERMQEHQLECDSARAAQRNDSAAPPKERPSWLAESRRQASMLPEQVIMEKLSRQQRNKWVPGDFDDTNFTDLLDEIRTAGTDEIDKYNHLVWKETSASKAIERTSDKEALRRALMEEPNLPWGGNGEGQTERQGVVHRAFFWLLEKQPKDHPEAWNQSTMIDGYPWYLEEREMRGANVRAFYKTGHGTWGFPPRDPPSAVKSKKSKPPPPPSEGALASRCIICGSEDPNHPDLWNCKQPRVDCVRTVEEYRLLAQLDAVKRGARAVRKKESDSESEKSLGSQDSYSSEEDGSDSGLASSRTPSVAQSSVASSAITKKPKSEKKMQKGIKTIGKDLHTLTKLMQMTVEAQQQQAKEIKELKEGRVPVASVPVAPKPSSSSRDFVAASELQRSTSVQVVSESDRSSPSKGHRQQEPSVASLKAAGTRTAASLPGMDGCPEIKPSNLLLVKALDEITKEYDEYVNLSHARDRKPKPFTTVFVKHSEEIAMKFNKLCRQGHVLAIQLCVAVNDEGDRTYTGDSVLEMADAEFAALYKEICTGGVKAPSQVLDILETTSFKRSASKGESKHGNEHDALVMRAAAAFREKIDSLPTEVVRKCTAIQIKRSFIRVVLGKGEGNLADYSQCKTWNECVEHMLDISSTDLSEGFMKRAKEAGGIDLESSDESDGWEERKSKKKRKAEKAATKERELTGDKGSKSKPTQETNADDKEQDIARWKDEFLRMKQKVKHTDADLAECGTYWKRVKKLRYIESQLELKESLKKLKDGGSKPEPSHAPGTWQEQSQQRGGQREHDYGSRGRGGYAQGGDAKQYRGQSPRREDGYQGQRTSFRSPSPYRQAENPPPPSRSQVPPPADQPRDTRALTCYNCQEVGHISSQCPKPQRARSPSRQGQGGAGASPGRS